MAYDERLNALALAAANIGTWHWDIRTNQVTWSDNIETMFGLQKGQFGGSHTEFLNLLPDADRQRLTTAIERSLSNNAPYEIEYRHIRSNGDIHWFLTKGSVIRDANGQPIEMSGTNQDITQKKLVDSIMDNLARSVPVGELEDFLCEVVMQLAEFYQCRYAFIGKLLPDRQHVQTLVVWAGDHYPDNFTYALQGTPCQDILDLKVEMIPRDAWRHYPLDTMLKDMSVESYFGAPLISSSGELLGLVSVMNTAPMDANNRNSKVLAAHAVRIANELERADAVAELRLRDERLGRQQHALIELSRQQSFTSHDPLTVLQKMTEIIADTLRVARVGIWLFKHDKSCITAVDLYEQDKRLHSGEGLICAGDYPVYFQALLSNRVISADDAYHMSETKEFAREYLPAYGIAAMLDAPIRRGHDITGVLCHEHVGLSRHWNIDEQNFASSAADIISMTLEIWEHKRTAEQLRQHQEHLESLVAERTRKLEALNNELEAFAYAVSHDLRAPLRAVDGFSQILAEDYAEQIDQQGKDYLRRLRAAAMHMNALIDAMLNLSRLTRGELQLSDVDLSGYARKITQALREASPGRSVQISIDDGITAKGDATTLYALLQNLLENAWKYTRRNSSAHIEFGRQVLHDQTVYYVRDNGAGFDMTYVHKLFGAFQRLHRAEDFEGIGIGLATAQRIVHRHGGKIWAEAEVNKGATFYFTLG